MDVVMGKQNLTDGMSCPIFPLAIDKVGELSVV